MPKLVECPKCGKMVDSRGLSVHMKFCEDDGSGAEITREHKEQDKKESVKTCHSCKGQNIQRLDVYQQNSQKKFNMKQLYKMGYTHVCVDCGEILK